MASAMLSVMTTLLFMGDIALALIAVVDVNSLELEPRYCATLRVTSPFRSKSHILFSNISHYEEHSIPRAIDIQIRF